MTDNEKLIEEARAEADATRNSVYTNAPLLYRLADALEAAEKAHDPAGDEREARLEYVIDAAVPVAEFPAWRFRYSRRIADAVRDAGFRQREDQGPAASCHLCVGAGGREGHDGEWVVCSCQRPEQQGEPSDAQVEAELIPGEPFTLAQLAAEHERLADHPHQMSQTTPAFHALTAKGLRWAALRAAVAATEQGENREEQNR